MADSAISDLTQAPLIQQQDLFVLEQNGEAKKLLGSQLTEFVNREIAHITIETLEPDQPASVRSYEQSTYTLTIGIPRGATIEEISDPVIHDTLYRTYTLNLEDVYGEEAREFPFTVKDGDYVSNIVYIGTETPTGQTHSGEFDVYEIQFAEREAIQFKVYNGQDGQGSPGSSTPIMDGTAYAGTRNAYSREDHVHPSDTSRVPTTRTINGAALTSDITTRLVFTNRAATNWTQLSSSASDYNEDFPWRGELSCGGVTPFMVPEVIFGIADAMSGDFAPIARIDTNGKVYIYAASRPSVTVTVQTVLAWV